MKTQMFTILVLMLVSINSWASVDWSEDFKLPTKDGKWTENNRENILDLNDKTELNEAVMSGRVHTLHYPVQTTELLIPYESVKRFMESDADSKLRKFIYKIGKKVIPFKSMDDLYNWIGLPSAPQNDDEQGPNPIPTDRVDTTVPMGTSFIVRDKAIGMTFSCAACHSQDLFGKKVLGLTNRFPRANELFRMGKMGYSVVNPHLYQLTFNATHGERKIVQHGKQVVNWIGVKQPQVLGLDTSLAQVGLSLNKREKDDYATKTLKSLILEKKHPLSKKIADSKPAVWWNLKYKTRWLSDGSVVSGNPIYTNFLWNEIGRGADLKKLEEWLVKNKRTVDELTAAVFSSKAPHITDFFSADTISIEKARRGHKVYKQACAKCHGDYLKNWNQPDVNEMTTAEKLKTFKVVYHAKTPVFNVGTDQGRYQGMKTFADDLNRLKISKSLGTVIKPQKGYVPPPLVGIWARWPYFHNNSIPNLCALLISPKYRPKKFYMGLPNNKQTDYDQACVGYPVKKVPNSWKRAEYMYDTTKEGLSNAGHFKMMLNKDGSEKYSWEQKLEIIEFLKTL